jgi:hypothetical protein
MHGTAQAVRAALVLGLVSIDAVDDTRGRLELDRVTVRQAMLNDLQLHGQLK